MKDISEAEEFIEDVLGKQAAIAFSHNMEDFFYYARSMALTDLDSTPASVRRRFHSISDGILSESIKVYLTENFASDQGKLEVDAVDGIVYDKNMNPIPAISLVKQRREEVIKEILDSIMAEFVRGRRLAKEIVGRIDKAPKPKAPPQIQAPSRNYRSDPPTEALEVEMMRLERRLPNLTEDEGKRLSLLYVTLGELDDSQPK